MEVEIFEFIFHTKNCVTSGSATADSYDPPTRLTCCVGRVVCGCGLGVHSNEYWKKRRSELNCNINGCDSQERQTSSPTLNSCHISFRSFLLYFIGLLFLVYRNSSLLLLLAPRQTQWTSMNCPRNHWDDVSVVDKTISLINCSRQTIIRWQIASICQGVVIFFSHQMNSEKFVTVTEPNERKF